MQDKIDWNPYDRENLHMPVPYSKQRCMELAIIPMFKVDVCLYHKPFIGWKQYQLSKELKSTMKKWFGGVEGRKKKIRTCKGLKVKDITSFCVFLFSKFEYNFDS